MSLEECIIKLFEIEKNVAVLRTAIEKDIAALHAAKVLQAVEYERRLELLNGEAARLKEIQALYLPRQEWEINKIELYKNIKDLQQYKDNATGRQTFIAILIPVIISILFTFLNLWISKPSIH